MDVEFEGQGCGVENLNKVIKVVRTGAMEVPRSHRIKPN